MNGEVVLLPLKDDAYTAQDDKLIEMTIWLFRIDFAAKLFHSL